MKKTLPIVSFALFFALRIIWSAWLYNYDIPSAPFPIKIVLVIFVVLTVAAIIMMPISVALWMGFHDFMTGIMGFVIWIATFFGFTYFGNLFGLGTGISALVGFLGGIFMVYLLGKSRSKVRQ